MDGEGKLLRMDLIMKGIGLEICPMAEASLYRRMGENMKDNSRMRKAMVTGNMFQVMARQFTRDSSLMMFSMDLAHK